MGSRGRRAAESRVGDEEMEEEKLYTKSKKDKSSTDCYLYSIFYSSCSSLCGSHQQKKLPFKDG